MKRSTLETSATWQRVSNPGSATASSTRRPQRCLRLIISLKSLLPRSPPASAYPNPVNRGGREKLNRDRDALINQQFEELIQTFPGLKLCQDATGLWVIRGKLSFFATFKAVTIADAFSILILLPDDYPDSPPSVQETGGRIPADFHQYRDRTLCLGAPVEVYRRFKTDPRLLAFVETLLVEYLYGYAHFEKYGSMPFGDLSHGCGGIREYYQEVFTTDDIQIVMALLKVMADGKYKGHHSCPCGSGKILRKCHGPVMLSLLKNQPNEQFLHDFMDIFDTIKKEDLKDLNLELFPKKLKLQFDKMKRESNKKKKCMTFR